MSPLAMHSYTSDDIIDIIEKNKELRRWDEGTKFVTNTISLESNEISVVKAAADNCKNGIIALSNIENVRMVTPSLAGRWFSPVVS